MIPILSIFDFLEDNIDRVIAVLGLIIAIAGILIPFIIKPYYERRKETTKWRKDKLTKLEREHKEEYPVVTSNSFIKPHWFTEEQEEGEEECDVVDNNLIDFFLNSVFKDKTKYHVYYVLAGTGYGKSTFSTALYYNFVKSNDYDSPIELYVLGEDSASAETNERMKTGILHKLQKIPNPSNTIIILDALDENWQAVNGGEDNTFIRDLEAIIKDKEFKYVIITCRTQMFPNIESEPDKGLGRGPNGTIDYKRVYITPFSDEDIENYLWNKHFTPKEYEIAINMVKNHRHIMARPLMLKFMEDLVKDFSRDTKIHTSFEIYYKIADKWLYREVHKKSEGLEMRSLFDLSKQIAWTMYNKWKNTGNYALTRGDFEELYKTLHYKECPYVLDSKIIRNSLLTRTVDGRIKFIHKSFLEFFLAIYAFENPGLDVPPLGFEMAAQFLNEIYSLQVKDELEERIRIKDELEERKGFKVNFQYIKICYKKSIQNTLCSLANQLNESAELIKTTSDTTRLREIYCETILNCWFTLVDSLKSIKYAIIASFKNAVMSSKQEKNSNLEEIFNPDEIYQDLNYLLYSIHMGFLDYDKPSQYDWIDGYAENIDKLINRLNNNKSTFIIGKSPSIVVSPELLSKKNGDIEAILSYKDIEINSSFHDDRHIADTLINMLIKTPGICSVKVLRNGGSIENYAEWIFNVSNKIKTEECIGTNNIVFSGVIDKIPVMYVINKLTIYNRPKDIINILNGMIQTRKIINDI